MYKKESIITDFLSRETSGGILLMGAAIISIIFANTPLNKYYSLLIDTPVVIRIGLFEIAKPLLLWVNDGLMAVFFLLVGLELKREFVNGELSEVRKIILPALGALGGMVVPALFYLVFNYNNSETIKGWAIPAATDIAFSLGVLALLGSRVPASLKIFLTSLAIFDDIGAILIIAFFYTSKISLPALFIAGVCLFVLFLLNRRNVEEKSPYFLVGLVMWIALLKSGVHATLAGVLLALFIPMKSKKNPDESPLENIEKDLHSVVAFFILPFFAFCNSGINLTGIGIDQLFHNVSLGIASGLFLGKQLGIFSFCLVGIKLEIARLPDGVSFKSLYGTAVLCGIGFTMSLFIGSLAFEETGAIRIFDERLGIIIGSLFSGIAGYLILKTSLNKSTN